MNRRMMNTCLNKKMGVCIVYWIQKCCKDFSAFLPAIDVDLCRLGNAGGCGVCAGAYGWVRSLRRRQNHGAHSKQSMGQTVQARGRGSFVGRVVGVEIVAGSEGRVSGQSGCRTAGLAEGGKLCARRCQQVQGDHPARFVEHHMYA